ncbi:MAG: FAD:protein FMN transferase [Nanoarchaeota archaeon]|nr:FAD:protein FMN transferase [Nanoarchaeota archaeon]
MAERIFKSMGGEIYLFIKARQEDQEETMLSFLEQEISSLVKIFDFFDEGSLLSKLNRERTVAFQKDLAFVLKKGAAFKKISKGKFDIFLGEHSIARKSNERSGQKGEGKSGVIINKTGISLEGKELVDLGGIAKGYIIDEALRRAREKFSDGLIDALIDARGDIVCYGKDKKLIEVENPFDESISFSTVALKEGAIITSGHNKQVFKEGSHIIGEESDILTISLVSKSKECYELDALGTYLLQLPSQEVMEKVEFGSRYKDIEALIILKEGDVLRTSFWESFQ